MKRAEQLAVFTGGSVLFVILKGITPIEVNGGDDMRKLLTLTLCCLAITASVNAMAADPELVEMAQKELIALGYEPGNIQGEVDSQTTVAVSKFQAENNMDVTGEVTPQLIGALRAAKNKGSQTAATSAAPGQMPQQQQLTLQQRQQACLQEKYAAAQERQKKKRGMMRLLRAASRTSGRWGSGDLSRNIGQISSDVYSATATADDLQQAGKDLGLTDDEMEECRNPQ